MASTGSIARMSPQALAVFLLTAAVVGSLASAAAAGPSVKPAKTVPSVVCWTGMPGTVEVERRPKRKPERCLLAERGGDGVSIVDLHYKHWNSRNAQGSGEMCAGPAGCIPVSVHLGKPQFTNSCDREIFSQVSIHVKGTERVPRRPQPLTNTCRPRHPV